MIKTYKCPNCGAMMNFSAKTNTLVCEHCGNSIEVSLAGQEDPDLDIAQADEGQDTDGNQIKEYTCGSCGAALATDALTTATVCAFCGSPALLPSRLSGDFKPSRIIPFKVEKKEAQKQLKEWAKSFKLTHSGFQSAAIMDKLTGVYVPFWLYSAVANAEVEAEGRKITTTTSDNVETTTTEYYEVERKLRNSYNLVPVDASEKMPDDSMQGLEPYNYDDLKTFQLPYLAGFQAEKYNNPYTHYEDTAWRGIEDDIIHNAEETITGYDETTTKFAKAELFGKRHEYALLPVWCLAYRYAGKTYPVYVNGQTGKIDGALPLSKGKVWLRFGIFFAAFFALALILGLAAHVQLFAKWFSWPILGLIAGGIAALIAKGSHNKRTYTSRRHYTTGEATVLLKDDRYVRTVTKKKELPKTS